MTDELVDAIARAIYEEGQPDYYQAWTETGPEAEDNRNTYRAMARLALGPVTAALADRDAKITAVEAEADALRAWCESAVRERKKLDGYSYRGAPCDRITCSLRNDPSNMQADCRFCENEDGYPQPLYLCEGPIPPRAALSLSVPTSPGRGFALPDGEVDQTPTMLDRPQFVDVPVEDLADAE